MIRHSNFLLMYTYNKSIFSIRYSYHITVTRLQKLCRITPVQVAESGSARTVGGRRSAWIASARVSSNHLGIVVRSIWALGCWMLSDKFFLVLPVVRSHVQDMTWDRSTFLLNWFQLCSWWSACTTVLGMNTLMIWKMHAKMQSAAAFRLCFACCVPQFAKARQSWWTWSAEKTSKMPSSRSSRPSPPRGTMGRGTCRLGWTCRVLSPAGPLWAGLAVEGCGRDVRVVRHWTAVKTMFSGLGGPMAQTPMERWFIGTSM